MDGARGRVIVVSAIDNLARGAASQAVHNLNLMAGFPETTGLEAVPLFLKEQGEKGKRAK